MIDNDRPFAYPETRREDVVDNYHGIDVADPYRWLEDPDSQETRAWVEAQNRLAREFVASDSRFQSIVDRLTTLWNFERTFLPFKEGDRYFYYHNDGLQNQSVLFTSRELGTPGSVVIDPNTLSTEGTVALSSQSVSRDATLVAYGLSYAGSDRQEIRIMEIDGGRHFDETLNWCRYSSPAWALDNSGFYYDRLPDPATVPPEDVYFHSRVYWHTLGTPQSEDRLVYERPDAKELNFVPSITDDGAYLHLHVWQGTDPHNRFYYRPIDSDGDFVRLLDEGDASYHFIDNIGSLFYFLTDLDAPRHRVIAIDLESPGKENWREIVPQGEGVIKSASIVADRLVLIVMRDAHDTLVLHDLEGRAIGDVELPGIGTVFGISGKRHDREMLVGFVSFLYPLATFRYDFATGVLETINRTAPVVDMSGYETRQHFYTSKDGTRVPMFLVHRRDVPLDGSNPTLLYGYGGFNNSTTPYYSTSWLYWIESGGVLALPGLRGGGEYGEEWHRAGTLERKQNVFDDFIAAAEELISLGYTSTPKLAIMGGSNGGLLVAACMVQRPELFGAVVCQVPVVDMLRYHRFSVGHYWIPEYGNAEAAREEFEYLYAYSPLHNVKPAAYPATMIRTGDHDDRVDPAHAKKFAATLQANQQGDAPILLRIETDAGHGLGKPTAKLIEDSAETYAFLFKVLGGRERGAGSGEQGGRRD